MAFIVAGVVLLVLGVPQTVVKLTDEVVVSEVLPSPSCWAYLSGLLLAVIALLCGAKRHAHKHPLYNLTLCALIASVTVIAARSFSSMVTLAFQGYAPPAANATTDDSVANASSASGPPAPPLAPPPPPPASYTVGDVLTAWVFYATLLVCAVTAVLSVKYLNAAMMLFGNSVVVPLYYCTFTLASVIGAAIVYDEFACMGLDDALMFSGGILAAIIGVWLLGGGRRPEASAECDTGSAAALPLAEALDAVRETTRDKLDGIRETTRDKLDKLPGSPGASWREAPSWREPRSSRDSEGDSAALAARREERRREERSSRRRRSSKGSSKAEGRGGLPPAVEQPETTLEDYEASGDFSDYEQSADDPPAPAVVNTAALARARAAKPRPSSSDLEGGGISLLPEPAINGGGPPSARGLGSSNTSLREVTPHLLSDVEESTSSTAGSEPAEGGSGRRRRKPSRGLDNEMV